MLSMAPGSAWRCGAHQVAVEAHQVAVESHHDAVEAHHGAMEAHNGAMEAHNGAVEAHQVIMEAHLGAVEANRGAVVSPWRHFSQISCLRVRYYKKFDRFKRRYHRFAPALKIDQTSSSNSYYVTHNSFLLFKTRGLIKNLNEDPAGHP